jgi:hypothetical protein
LILKKHCLISFRMLTPNARHHPPPRAIIEYENRRVGGRVHAVVRCVVGTDNSTGAINLPFQEELYVICRGVGLAPHVITLVS